jgi:hypothetical protein
MWSRRTFCDTLQEMRDILATITACNYSQVAAHLKSLIEENQTYGNRMEAGLSYGRSLTKLHDEVKELELKAKALKKELGVKDDGEDY